MTVRCNCLLAGIVRLKRVSDLARDRIQRTSLCGLTTRTPP